MALRVITCLPNGRVLEDRVRDVPGAPAPVGRRFAPHVIVDGKLSKVPIAAPVESLKFDWTANRALGFAAATLWRDRKIALTMVYLASDSSQSLKLGLMFAGKWEDTPAVKEVTQSKRVFSPHLSLPQRPLALAVNWATISPKEMASIGDPVFDIGAAFLRQLLVATPISVETAVPGWKRLLGWAT
jgi:hypothetical protein